MVRNALASSLLLLAACTAPPRVTGAPTPSSTPALGVDTHLHLTMAQAAVPLFKGEAGDGRLPASPGYRLINQVDLPGLRAAGVRLVHGALWPPNNTRAGFSRLDEALEQVRELHHFAARRGGFVVVKSAAEARQAVAHDFVAVFPSLEGAEGIESVEDVDRLYAAGVRSITVMHFVSTQLGGAAQGQLGAALLGLRPSGDNDEGASPLGREVLQRMVQLGIVIDLAHASEAFVGDALDVTGAAGVPVLVSHTGARALADAERNLSDALARRVAQGGGLIGLAVNDRQLSTPESARLGPSHQPGTCDDLVAHWKHFAQVVPATSLVLGTDFNGFITRPVAGGACPRGLRHYGDVQDLWPALTAQGFPQAALDGMGEALLELHEAVEAKADPSAQARALVLGPHVLRARSALDEAP